MLSNLLEKFIDKCNFYIKYFDKTKCSADRPYLVFSELKPETHIYFHFCLTIAQRYVGFARIVLISEKSILLKPLQSGNFDMFVVQA